MKITSLPNPSAPQTTPQLSTTRTIKMKTVSGGIDPVLATTPGVTPEPGLNTPSESVESAATTEATVATLPLTPQYAKLAREQKAIREERLKLKAEQEAWESKRDAEYISKETLKANTLQALADAGISSEHLLQQQIDAPSPQETQAAALKAEIDALKAELGGFKTEQQQKVSQDYQQAVNVIRQDVKLLIEQDPSFETIKSEGASEDVVKLIEKVFHAEQLILSPDEAAKLVEEKLLERTVNQYKKLSQLKKLQARLAPSEPAQPQSTSTGSLGKTLTNKMGSARQLSARERAILAFNNQLKTS